MSWPEVGSFLLWPRIHEPGVLPGQAAELRVAGGLVVEVTGGRGNHKLHDPTEANELLKPIHDRMPGILTREAEAVWLDPTI